MPKERYTGPDPDPTEYLYVSLESKRISAAKPYDAKKACWVPSTREGYVQGEIRGTKGDQVTVFADNKEQTLKKEQVLQVNPPKFDKMEDMSNLTYLNDATVLWNLKDRYYNKLIYTYSGLFCVAVNPYRRYPIYTPRVVSMYRGKRKTEMPPHIFATADGAYNDMLNNRENQSMLITGESGAGKTENTKKVISYFATVGANEYKDSSASAASAAASSGKKANLEEQVVQTNPVLEAFGNAKTVRNDNSSRFGKFIRIHFMNNGKLAGADIETYLLEKARVISQQPGERSYHIFYQLMSGADKDMKEKLLLTDKWEDFPNQSMGLTEIEGMNEVEEMETTDSCMDVLGFKSEEKLCIYKIVAAVMHFGTLKFKQRGREEQAEADGTKEGEKVAKLLDLDSDDLYRNLLKPKIKVGNEFVTQGRNKDQVNFSIGGLCKAIFDKLFKWIVEKCNATLSTKAKKAFFIGVLDIAGFEIFDFNSFEQLCINFTNEKLQQFFNHHMFVLEQEEYQREGIQWTFIDFGLDLQACIDLIEKPLGIFSILEEESMFPKASDKTFEEKLKNNHMGKTPNFTKAKGLGKDSKDASKDPHFGVMHYAGTVQYNVNGWLEKNKDPLNETVVDQFRHSSNKILGEVFDDPTSMSDQGGGMKAKRQKGSTFQTVSALYREQVENLMSTLRATSPHFIRCIIPNENKEPGFIDAKLVMHQLTCNGVLEGIRICRKGFPNRMQYKEFRQRYLILASTEMCAAPSDKEAAAICFQTVGLEEDKYRLGHTKLFFRTGVVAFMEELREAKIQTMMSSLQAQCRTYLSMKKFKRLADQREATEVFQRYIRMYMNMKLWLWFRLWSYLRPLLQVGITEDRIRELEKKVENQKLAMREEEKRIETFEKELDRALGEKQKLQMELEEQRANLEEIESREAKMKLDAQKRAEEIKEAQEKLQREEDARNAVEQAKKKAEGEIKNLKQEIRDIEAVAAKAEQARQEKEHQIRSLADEIDQQDGLIARLNKEKKQLQEVNQKHAEEIQAHEDKNKHLAKLKTKLESSLDEVEDALEKEKKARIEQERIRRKAEAEIKSVQSAVEAAERHKKELEASNQRKEKEIAALADKLGSEQAGLLKANKQIKECGVRIDDLEEELEAERGFRTRAEQQRSDAAKELQELHDRLEEAGGATAAQMELNRKREIELAKMKKEAEEAAIAREAALAQMRKKHGEAVTEMEEQMEIANRARQKLEREKGNLQQELAEKKSSMDQLKIDKAMLERDAKSTMTKLTDAQLRLDEYARNMTDLEVARNKLYGENQDLERRLDESEVQTAELNKIRLSLATQLEDSQKLADDESRERVQLMSRYRTLEGDRDSMRQHLEEALEEKADVMRQLARANSDAMMWRSKYESESAGKIDELEHAKMKLQARLAEAEDTIEGLNTRCTSLEKLKQRLLGEIDDLQTQVDSANQMAISLEKRAKNFDKVIAEWKSKVEDLQQQLDESQRENRENAAEVYRTRAMFEDARDQLDSAKKENKNLSLEVKDLLDQIGEGGRSLHEVDRQRRRLEGEKEELANALDEAEAALEAEENRTIRAQFELAQLKQEINQRVREKCEEYEAARKTQQKFIESLQASLEAETRSKAEVIRTKKKLETDIQELESALDHASKANAEAMANCRRQMNEMRELRDNIEELRRLLERSREDAATSERKAAAASIEAEEARTLHEAAEKSRRSTEHELSEARENLNETVAANQSLTNAKRVLETEVAAMRAEMDEIALAMRNSEDKAKRAALDAMRLAEEVRCQQERVSKEETERRIIESHARELQLRLEEAEANALRGGRKMIEKLEARVKALIADLDMEQRFKSDLVKNLRKSERRMREMEFQLEEEHKNNERFQELNEKLHSKVRSFKQQVEDAEEIAALNLAKFRKAQEEYEESEKRANLAEAAMGKLRAKSVMRGETPF